MDVKVWVLPNPRATDGFGEELAKAVRQLYTRHPDASLAVRLYGDLGAGKTSLVRAFLRSMGVTGPVKSPTFSLVESYPLDCAMVHHFDFYRFEDPIEFEEAGFRDYFAQRNLCFTEWTQKAEPYIPDADLRCVLEHDGLGRKLTLKAKSELGKEMVACLPHVEK